MDWLKASWKVAQLSATLHAITDEGHSHNFDYVHASILTLVQGLAKVGAPGLVNFISAVAYHFCPACSAHSRNLVHRL